MRTRWITLAICTAASAVLIGLAQGWVVWAALVLPVIGWFVAERPDSLWPLGWIGYAVVVWFAGSAGGLWGAAAVALAAAAVHIASAIAARSSSRARTWARHDWWRFGGFLAVSGLAMGVVGGFTFLPVPSGLIWVVAAVVLVGFVAVLVRFSLNRSR